MRSSVPFAYEGMRYYANKGINTLATRPSDT